jgi:hypothetical protein
MKGLVIRPSKAKEWKVLTLRRSVVMRYKDYPRQGKERKDVWLLTGETLEGC